MATKRTRVSRTPDTRITAEAVEAFKAGDAPLLHQLLKLRPWEISPLSVDDEPSPYGEGSGGHTSWPQAQELRAELERAANS